MPECQLQLYMQDSLTKQSRLLEAFNESTQIKIVGLYKISAIFLIDAWLISLSKILAYMRGDFDIHAAI